MMNKKVCFVTWILFQEELLKNITQKRQTNNINFWYLCYNIGLYLGYFTYKIPKINESQILYCKKIGNKNMEERLVKEIKDLFKHKPIVFCFNNIENICVNLWNYIRENYVRYNKKR